MEYIHNTEQFQFHNTVVALGKFDGMHKGHQMIFDELIKYKEMGYQAAVTVVGNSEHMSEEMKTQLVIASACDVPILTYSLVSMDEYDILIDAVFSIKTRLGIPIVSIAWVSIAFACSPEYISFIKVPSFTGIFACHPVFATKKAFALPMARQNAPTQRRRHKQPQLL